MALRLAAALMLLFACAPKTSSAESTPTSIGAQWPRSQPEAQGMSSSQLAKMLERIASDNPGIHSVTVIRHGTVVLDARVSPFAVGDRHDIHSCTKSVLSALVGIAIDRGELPDVDTHVLDLFPDTQTAHLDGDKRALTIRHLLTMSAGLKTEDSYLHDWLGLGKMLGSPDWSQYILDLPLDSKPGSRFEYSNCVSELIAIILQRATGRSAAAYAREHLFGPLGIVDFAWQGSGPDDSWGHSGLSLHPLDMARIGYLYLHGGAWNGTQVVPKDWVQASTSPQIESGTLAPYYGYQWWVGDDRFMMQGYGGQFVFVLPDQDLLVVFTGALPQRQFATARNLLRNYIEASVVADHPLSANSTAATHLDELTRRLGGGIATPLPSMPDLAWAVSGRNFEFAENNMGLQRLIMRFTPGSPEAYLEFALGAVEASVPIGLDGIFRRSSLLGQNWACRGRWSNDETFVLEQEAPGKVLRRHITLSFQADTLSFEAQDQITGAMDVYSATMTGTPAVVK